MPSGRTKKCKYCGDENVGSSHVRWCEKNPRREENRKKQSLAHKGKVKSEEHRKKLSIASKGRKHSDEAKKNMSLAKKGKIGHKHTDKTKEKMSKTHTGKTMSEEAKKNIFIAFKSRVGRIHNLQYDSITEKEFIELCVSRNIKIYRGDTVNFIHEGKKRWYRIDFHLPEYNLQVELKKSDPTDYENIKHSYAKTYCKNTGQEFIVVKNSEINNFVINLE